MPSIAEHRRNQIIEHLANEPDSIKGMEEALGINYYTLRKDIAALKEEGRIFDAPIFNRGVAFYQANRPGTMPTIIVKSTGRLLRLDEYTHNYIASGLEPASVKSLHDSLAALVELLELARSYDQDDWPKGLSGNDAVRANNRLKARLKAAYTVLDNNLYAIRQVLNHAELWNPIDLVKITTDANFNAQLVRADWEFVTREVEPNVIPEGQSIANNTESD